MEVASESADMSVAWAGGHAQGDGCRAPGRGQGRGFGRRRLCSAQLFRHAHHRGQVPAQTHPPFSPAGRFSGRVAAVGPEVTGFAVGDRIMGPTGYGAARERIAVPARSLAHVFPDGLPLRQGGGPLGHLWDDAARLPTARRTEARRDPRRARRVGGVGLAAVEIGLVMGAKVIACASSDEKLEFVKRYGAVETMNSPAPGFPRPPQGDHRRRRRRRDL